MERSIARRAGLMLFWIAACAALTASAVFVAQINGANTGKSAIRIRDDWWLVRTAWMLLSVMLAGASLGASFGIAVGRVRYWPIAGIFVWMLVVYIAMVVHALAGR